MPRYHMREGPNLQVGHPFKPNTDWRGEVCIERFEPNGTAQLRHKVGGTQNYYNVSAKHPFTFWPFFTRRNVQVRIKPVSQVESEFVPKAVTDSVAQLLARTGHEIQGGVYYDKPRKSAEMAFRQPKKPKA